MGRYEVVGDGTLGKNEKKVGKQPDYRGKLTLREKTDDGETKETKYLLSGWVRENSQDRSRFLSLEITLPGEEGGEDAERGGSQEDDF